jgi:DNA-binding XRE family transcriptional regulator
MAVGSRYSRMVRSLVHAQSDWRSPGQAIRPPDPQPGARLRGGSEAERDSQLGPLKPPRESTSCSKSAAPDRRTDAILGPSTDWPQPPRNAPMNRIRAARQALGWTQNDLAKRAQVSPRTIHAVEKGRACRQATKRHILNALGVPWELRDEYFVRARSVRPAARPVREIRSA